MAEIPVQQKSGARWWVWALLALLVIGLLVWLLSDNDEADVAVVDPAAQVVAPVGTIVPPATGPITDLATILGTADMGTLVGRQVRLSNVTVQDVVGDRGFWVGPDANQRAFVVLNEVPTPGKPGVEGRYDVTAGQVINVNGLIRHTSDPAFGGQPIEGLPAGQQAVIHAESLDIVQRP